LLKKLLVRVARQSPAMIVAMLALFVALTGTAVATTSALIGGAQIRNNSITGLDVKNRSLRPIDFRGSIRGPRGLRGLPGAAGAPGTAGATGAKGDKGDTGEAGTAVAYALVTAAGTVETNGPVKGITDAMITHPLTGVYCFRGLPAGAKIALVSANNFNTQNDTLVSVYTNNTGGIVDCDPAAGDRFRVRTYDVSGAALADHDFVIWFED
jgi:Collagen triple helix repeat (20 copies)